MSDLYMKVSANVQVVKVPDIAVTAVRSQHYPNRLCNALSDDFIRYLRSRDG